MITLADYLATLLVGFVFLGGIYWLGPKLYDDMIAAEPHWIPGNVRVSNPSDSPKDSHPHN